MKKIDPTAREAKKVVGKKPLASLPHRNKSCTFSNAKIAKCTSTAATFLLFWRVVLSAPDRHSMDGTCDGSSE